VGLGQDDVGGEFGLQRIGGVQGGDRRHGDFVAGGAGFGRIGAGRGKAGAEVGEDFARAMDGGGWEECTWRGRPV
jgi:hypothetical protein